MAATDLNRAIQATLEVARNEYKYVADVETDLGDLPHVTCLAGELNQVFLNIVVNAAHAIADAVKGTQARGTIRIATRRDGCDGVVVAISDTGTGIPEAIRSKIFDPFFTTKEVGRGTGQGLGIARRIVERHRGRLTFTTAMGQGTTFLVRLPIESRVEPDATPSMTSGGCVSPS
jgi:two-component system NtrC family sensor kinase